MSVDDVVERMSFAPDIADDLVETPPPSAETLRAIREEIDPSGALLRA